MVAYVARIEQVRQSGLAQEAEMLLGTVTEQYPHKGEHWEGLQAIFAVRRGDLDAVVAPLADPDCSPQKQAAITVALRQELRDPARLAATDALPQSTLCGLEPGPSPMFSNR